MDRSGRKINMSIRTQQPIVQPEKHSYGSVVYQFAELPHPDKTREVRKITFNHLGEIVKICNGLFRKSEYNKLWNDTKTNQKTKHEVVELSDVNEAPIDYNLARSSLFDDDKKQYGNYAPADF